MARFFFQLQIRETAEINWISISKRNVWLFRLVEAIFQWYCVHINHHSTRKQRYFHGYSVNEGRQKIQQHQPRNIFDSWILFNIINESEILFNCSVCRTPGIGHHFNVHICCAFARDIANVVHIKTREHHRTKWKQAKRNGKKAKECIIKILQHVHNTAKKKESEREWAFSLYIYIFLYNMNPRCKESVSVYLRRDLVFDTETKASLEWNGVQWDLSVKHMSRT